MFNAILNKAVILRFIKRPWAIFLIVVIVAGIFGAFYFLGKSGPAPEIVIAKRGEIAQEVSVTGKTKPGQDVDLAFEQTGKVRAVRADVGGKVYSGQSLVELDSSELYAQLSSAEANSDSKKADLAELKKGATPEEITVYNTKLLNSRQSLADAKKKLADKIQDAYTKSDDAIRADIDPMFTNPRSLSPSLNFSYYLEADLGNSRVAMESLLTAWQVSLAGLAAAADPLPYADSASGDLDRIKSFLEKMVLAVNSLAANSNLSQTTINTYTSDVSTARTNINTAIANLQAAESDYNDAVSAVQLAEKELAQKQAGSTPEQIAGQEALVKKAEADADLIRVKIEKNILRSPISGIVTRQDAKVGEIAAANTALVSVISGASPRFASLAESGRGEAGGFELEASVPEADIAKVKVGDEARVTLDAFGPDIVFRARVTKIDPAEIVIEGVATYKTTFQFETENGGVKSGMTANIDISTAKKEGVIVIPQRAVISKNGDKFVRILSAGKVKEVKIQTGLRGIDGNIEIIEGVKEGEAVIVSAK